MVLYFLKNSEQGRSKKYRPENRTNLNCVQTLEFKCGNKEALICKPNQLFDTWQTHGIHGRYIADMADTWQTHGRHGKHMADTLQTRHTHGRHMADKADTWQTHGRHSKQLADMAYTW